MPRDEEFVADVYSESKKSDAQIERSRKILSKFNKEQRNAVLKASALGGAVAAVSARVITELGNVERATKRFFDNFTMAPLLDGLHEYEEQLASIRTMATNASQFEDDEKAIDRIASATGKVNKAMKQLNEYADLTVYKFSDMTYAAQRFVTAGLTIEDSAAMTQGIGNLVAFLGGDKQAYSTAVEMFSQAMSSGKMMAYQFNSLSRQGLTGEAMQRIFISTAKAMGKDAPEWEELSHMYNADGTLNTDFDNGESFKDSLTDDWLTSDVLRQVFLIMSGLDELGETILQFKEDGSLTDESQIALDQYLSSLGYDKETTEFIENMVVEGQKAATKVKTYSEFIGATQEAIGTGWAAVFQNLLGDYDEASKLWSDLLNEVTGDNGIGHIMKYLEKEFGNLNENDRANMSAILFNVWTMIKNITKSIGNLLGVSELKDGALVTKVQKLLENLRGITDILSGNALVEATKPIGKIANFLRMIWGHLKNILGAVKKLAGSALRGVWELLGTMFESLHGPIDTLLTWLEGLIDRIANSEMLKKIGSALKEMVQGLLELSGSKLSSGLSSFFDAFSGAKVTGFGGFVDALVGFFQSLGGMFNGEGNVGSFLGTSGKLLLGLIMLVAAFKLIAKVGKSFNGVESNFWTIITTIFAIVLGVKLLNKIDIEEASQLVAKVMILAAPIWLFTKVITKIAKAGKMASENIGGLLALFAIISAFVFGIYELSAHGQGFDKFEMVVDIIAKVAANITGLSLALAAFFASLTFLIWIVGGRDNPDAKDLVTRKLFGVDLRIDSLSMRLGAIAAILSAISLFMQSIQGIPDMSWEDIGKIGALIGGLAIILTVVTALGKILAKGSKTESLIEKSGGLKGTKSVLTERTGAGSPTGFLLSSAVLIIALVGAVALIQKVADKITMGNGTIAKMWIVYGMMAAMLVLVGLVGLLSAVPGYNSWALIPMALVIGSLALVMYELIGVAALLKKITPDELDKLEDVVWMFTLIVLVVGLMSAIGNLAGGVGVALSMAMIAAVFMAVVAIFRAVTEEDISKIEAVTNALKTAFMWITILIAIFAVIAIIAGASGVGGGVLLLAGAAFLAFGLSIAAVGAGALLFVKAMEKMIAVIKKLNGTSFDEFMNGIANFQLAAVSIGTAIGATFFAAVDSFLTQLAGSAYTIADKLIQIINAITLAIIDNADTIIWLGFELGVTLGEGLIKGLGVAIKNLFATDHDYWLRPSLGYENSMRPGIVEGPDGSISFTAVPETAIHGGSGRGTLSGSTASPAIDVPVDLNGNPASGSATTASENGFMDKLIDKIVDAISGWAVNIDGEAAGRMANDYLGMNIGSLE